MDAAFLKDTLAKILQELNLPFEKIDVEPADGNITRLNITSSQASRIIGWHGESLNSIQHVLKSIVRTKEKLDRSPFILIDVDGYRKMQEEKVCKIAEQKADFVRRTGNRVALAPMSPYFRRVVHLHFANTPALADLTTESSGEGDYRQIVIRLKDPKGTDSGELSPVIEESNSDDGLDNLDI